VSCIGEIERLIVGTKREKDRPLPTVGLVTCDARLKVARNLKKRTEKIFSLDVREITDTSSEFKFTKVVKGNVTAIRPDRKIVELQDGSTICFHKLCICSGARPSLIDDNPFVVGIRDVDSVLDLARRLQGTKRLCIVGNGGIAIELVHALFRDRSSSSNESRAVEGETKCQRKDIQLDWVIRDRMLGHTFLDRTSSAFLLPFLFPEKDPDLTPKASRPSPTATNSKKESVCGSTERPMNHTNKSLDGSLGPYWLACLDERLNGASANLRPKQDTVACSKQTGPLQPNIKMHFETEVSRCVVQRDEMKGNGFPLRVELKNGDTIQCDLLVSATGVVPNTEFVPGDIIKLGPDGGVCISETMQTSHPNIFAAGDACFCSFASDNPTWLQMRLWTQAHTMGIYAARAMLGQGQELGFNFDVFAHSTHFFGQPVVLLGNFNAQDLGTEGKDYKVLIRCKPGEEFIRVIVMNHRVVGASLVGDTELAETLENLIANQISISSIEDELLREDVDLEDYFD